MGDLTTRAVRGAPTTLPFHAATAAFVAPPPGATPAAEVGLGDPAARRLVDARPQVGLAGGPTPPSDVVVSAPARDAANRQQYVVTVSAARVKAEQAPTVTASIQALARTQTDRQKALSNESRGRWVLFLDEAQAKKLKDAGVGVFPDYQIELKRRATPAAAEGELLSRTIHGADAIEAEGFDGKGVAVVVIDTGTSDHPDLPPRLAQDDVFTPEPDDPVTDDVGHSTHVSGISAARGDPAEGHMRGMAPAADLMSAKVLENGGGTWSSVLAGVDDMIRWAQSYDGPVVGNLSLGGPSTGNPDEDPLDQLLDEAVREHGIFVAVAAGNEGPDAGTIGTPGDARLVTTVAAVDHAGTIDRQDDEVAWFSSRGERGQGKPNLAADGVEVFSTVPGDGYESWSGTSMATPNVAGAAAALLGKLWAMYRDGDLRVDPRELVKRGEVQAVLLSTAARLPGATPEEQGAGDLRLDRAAEVLLDRWGRTEVKRAVRELMDVVQSAWDDDGVVSADEVAEAIRQVLEPEASGSLSSPDDRLDYAEAARDYLEGLAAGDGPQLDEAALAELRGVMARLALSAVAERAESPFESADRAATVLDQAIAWAKAAGGVSRGEATLIADFLSESCRQLPPGQAMELLSRVASTVRSDPALEALAGPRSRLFEVAHAVLEARSRQRFASASEATDFFETALTWAAYDVDASPARASRALSDLVSSAARRLAPIERVAFLREAAAAVSTYLASSPDEAAAIGADVQAGLVAAIGARARDAAAPYATGAEAAESVDALVTAQLADGDYDADDVSALAVLLDELVRGGASDGVVADPDQRKALLRGAQRPLERLLSLGHITAAQRIGLWRQLNDTINEHVRALHRRAAAA